MYYEFPITIPASTEERNPVRQTLRLARGVIRRVEVEFPAGCHRLVHVRLYRQGYQLFPTNRDSSFASDRYVIPIDDYIPLDSAPFTLSARAWNDDDTYDHTITIRIGIPDEPPTPEPTELQLRLEQFLNMVLGGGA